MRSSDTVGWLRFRARTTGKHIYEYDGLGLVQKHKFRDRVFEFDYDGLGRLSHATSPDGTYDWTWDGDGTDPSLVGHLEQESLTSASLGDSHTRYEYHGPGSAVTSVFRTIEGVEYTSGVEYDEFGRPKLLRYPGARPFAVKNTYTDDGRVRTVEEPASGRVLWQLDGVDAFENLVATTNLRATAARTFESATGRLSELVVTSRTDNTRLHHERLTWDVRGLLETRNRPQTVGLETFVHDALGRLDHRYWNNQDDDYNYTPNGNLTRNPRVGTLHYDAEMAQQVTSTDDGRGFEYDDYGNQNVRTREGESSRQEITFTSFNLPSEVRLGPHGAPTSVTQYRYDSANRRTMELGPNRTVVNIGDEVERRVEGGKETWLAHVALPDGQRIEAHLAATGSHELAILVTDYQGSITTLVRGQERHPQTYDAFGAPTADLSGTRMSYTGQEYDRELGLLNMRGRMYDPTIGRFVSPDPLVQDPTFSQSWNRYSYVMNSPHNLVDPSGFEAVQTCGAGMAPCTTGVDMAFQWVEPAGQAEAHAAAEQAHAAAVQAEAERMKALTAVFTNAFPSPDANFEVPPSLHIELPQNAFEDASATAVHAAIPWVAQGGRAVSTAAAVTPFTAVAALLISAVVAPFDQGPNRNSVTIINPYPADIPRTMQLYEYMLRWSARIPAAGLVTRTPTDDDDRESRRWREKMVRNNPWLSERGLVVGHVPDVVWGGSPNQGNSWMALDRGLNSSIGAQVQRYGAGYRYYSVHVAPDPRTIDALMRYLLNGGQP